MLYVLYLQDNELQDLRDTIEVMKYKNTEAQVIIQGALNTPDATPPKGWDFLIQQVKISWLFWLKHYKLQSTDPNTYS